MGWCIGCQRKWSAKSGWGIGNSGMLFGGAGFSLRPQHLAAGEIRLIFWFWLEIPCIRRG